MLDNDLKKVSENEAVKSRLKSIYPKVRAQNLYNFFILIKAQGLQEVRKNTCKSMYYKNVSDLKNANVDFSQKMNINMEDIQVQFNPFEAKEVP